VTAPQHWTTFGWRKFPDTIALMASPGVANAFGRRIWWTSETVYAAWG